MIRLLSLALLLSPQTAVAQAPKPVQPAVPEEIVDCRSLPGLSSALLRNLGNDVRCRLERRDVTCVPGLTLSKNMSGDHDLCVTEDKRPVGSPYCVAKNTSLYGQKIIQRGRFIVDMPDGTSPVRWLDIPFGETGRKDVLVQRKPIVRPGWDVCVYLRKEVLYQTRRQTGQVPQTPAPAQAP